ncbi:hypothetical protein RYG49_001278 [Salmonella enterica]|nr:hypothetical protein [Salmonella enterica]
MKRTYTKQEQAQIELLKGKTDRKPKPDYKSGVGPSPVVGHYWTTKP